MNIEFEDIINQQLSKIEDSLEKDEEYMDTKQDCKYSLDRLSNSTDSDQAEKLQEYLEDENRFIYLRDCEIFKEGFKLGLQVMIETLK